jgi:hypothetical protein
MERPNASETASARIVLNLIVLTLNLEGSVHEISWRRKTGVIQMNDAPTISDDLFIAASGGPTAAETGLNVCRHYRTACRRILYVGQNFIFDAGSGGWVSHHSRCKGSCL